MLNRKGGVAIGRYVGMIVFVFVIVILGLSFLGCSVSRAKQDYEVFQISKAEVEIIRDLNLFLEIPVGDGKIMLDLILELSKEFIYNEDSSKNDLDRFRTEMSEIFQEYFSSSRRLMIINSVGGMWYDSFGNYAWRDISYDELIEGTVKLPIATESGGYAFIEVVLQPLGR